MASTTGQKCAWVTHTKEEISSTDEWKELVAELFEAVQQQLTENHVSYFSDLTESEKILFLDRASRLVRPSLRHDNLVAKVSSILDQQINEDIMEDLVNPSNTKSKTELVLDSACDVCVNLLQKWPDLRNKLFSCLNRPLPPKLRRTIWEMFLANPKEREKYLNRNTSKAISYKIISQNNAISQRCEAFLNSEPSFQNLPENQFSYVVSVMKNCLIYTQSSHMKPLGDTDYLIVIPFLKVLVKDSSLVGNGNHSDENVGQFIEVFSTFMELRPAYMKDSGTKEFKVALNEVGQTMAIVLESQNYQLAASLLNSLSQGNRSVALSTCLSTLMRSYLRCLFVGYLPLDVVCYILDQHILSLKLPKLNCLPTFAVVLLILLKEKLMTCNTEQEVTEALLQGSKTLKTRQFQNEIDNRFMPQWRQAADKEIQGSVLPLVDPVATLGATQPWTWWFQERPVTRLRPEDRHAAREAREIERLQKQQQQRKEEIYKRREDEQKKTDKEVAMRNAFNLENRTQAEKIVFLKHKLEQEQLSRHTVEQHMRAEIARLQEQLEGVRVGSSLHSRVPTPAGSASLPPTPALSNEQEVDDLLRDLLRNATGGVNHLVHGTGRQEQELENIAQMTINSTRQEYKEAVLTLFGREFTKENWYTMSPEEHRLNADLLLNKLRQLHG